PPDGHRARRQRRALRSARGMHRGDGGRGRHGRHDAAAQPPGRGFDAGSGRRAGRGPGRAAGTHGRGRAGDRQEGAGWIVRQLGGHHGPALPRSRNQVSGEAAHGWSVTLALPARAKLNLDLAVVGRRSDGLHELRTHVQSIDLHDLLEVAPAEATSLSLSGVDVPGGAGNTVLLAQKALETAVGRPLPAKFALHKRIPPGSGLGGASSDAAAALRALVALHHLDVELEQVAAGVGADVTFFVRGGAALLEGAGERVTPIAVTSGWFALAWPGIELSTAAVYGAWDEVAGEGTNQLRRAA